MKQLLSKSDLITQLQNQLSKLKIFNRIFDEGDLAIAQEIAVKLRVIFHNTNNSKSLLHQLKLQHIDFVDTSDKFNSYNRLAHLGLLIMRLKPNHLPTDNTILPKLATAKFQFVTFQNWWDNKKVLKDINQNIFTRKKLIHHLANQDGGAHVDPELDSDYYEISRKNTIGWSLVDSKGQRVPLNDPVLPSIRQISYEAIETFNKIDISNQSKLR
jgi:hypothetical protein